MNKSRAIWIALAVMGTVGVPDLEAVIHRSGQEGRSTELNRAGVHSAEEHFGVGMGAVELQNWPVVKANMKSVVTCYPHSPLAKEARYYLGLAYLRQHDYDAANQEFSDYLKYDRNPKHFEEVYAHKMEIASAYGKGAKRHLFYSARMPRWVSGKEDALDLYDEISITLPSSALAAEALFSKGMLLASMKQHQEAIESLQILIARFPKHPHAPDSYVAIANLYLALARKQCHDPDLLALAQINLRKFRYDYPTDQRIERAEACLGEMREVYAQGLYATGQFYERKKKPASAVVYYRAAERDYPDTRTAATCHARLVSLGGPTS